LELKHEWDELERRIEEASAELQRIAKQDDACSRLMEIPGIGPLVSTALVASVGNAITFRKGRDLAAWLGLVPRQHSTGGRAKLLGISKRGNEYLRRMLLHGARSVMMQVERNPSALGVWITDLSKRKHHNVTAVALANKMARIAWAMLTWKSETRFPTFPTLLLRRCLIPLRVCETNQCVCERSKPALLKSVWKCELLEFGCLCRPAMRGLHYGQELSSTNRPDTFAQTNHPRQRFCLQSGGGPYNFHDLFCPAT
jgi:hypothetical protein